MFARDWLNPKFKMPPPNPLKPPFVPTQDQADKLNLFDYIIGCCEAELERLRENKVKVPH